MGRTAEKWFASLLIVFISAWGADAAEEQKGPAFEGETYYSGGSYSNWWAGYPGWQGLGFSAAGDHLYVASGENASGGNRQTLVLKLSVPPGPAATWALRWPNDQRIKNSSALLPGMVATNEGFFLVGNGQSSTVSRYGVWGNTSTLVKYSLDGAIGPAAGGALWENRPVFYPAFNGTEALWDVIAVKEGGSTFLYASGEAEAADENVTAVVAKFDTKGTLLWQTALVQPAPRSISHGFRLTAVNGQIYVAGSLNPDTRFDSSNWRAHIKPVLWRVDPSGKVIWIKTDPRSILEVRAAAVAGSEGSIVLVTTLLPASGKSADVLMLSYDPNGNLLWSKEWGTSAEDIARAAVVAGGRLYVAGETRGWVGGEKDVFLLEVELSTGNVLSVQYHGGKLLDRAFRLLVVGTELYVLGDSTSHSTVVGMPELMLLRYNLALEPPLLTVKIDIKPDSFPNSIQPESEGNIPVAILSSAGFNAPKLVDPNSLTFGRTGDEKSLQPGKVHPEDVNKDGFQDLVCHFDTPKTGFQVGDLQGILKGKLFSGRLFVGVDSVRILEKKQTKEQPREIRKELPKEPPKQELRRQPPPVEKVQPVPLPRKPAPGLGSPSPKDLRRLQEDGGVAY